MVGVEPEPTVEQIGREKYGLTLYSSVLVEIGFPPDTFDAVTMIHVIEHLPDPIRTLNTANRLLKKGAVSLYIHPLYQV
jgi:ubiquinone/menaquinone biosynthesis C-methylase UbiE